MSPARTASAAIATTVCVLVAGCAESGPGGPSRGDRGGAPKEITMTEDLGQPGLPAATEDEPRGVETATFALG